MATAFEREVLDVLTTIRHHTSLDAAGLLLQHNANRYLRPAQEMVTLFRDIPSAIAETRELSSRLQFEMKDMGYQFPLYPVGDDETMDSFLYKRTMEGVLNRYGAKSSASLRKRAEKQVARELALIAKLASLDTSSSCGTSLSSAARTASSSRAEALPRTPPSAMHSASLPLTP